MLDGAFDLDIGGETKRVKKGNAFHIPTGIRHTVTRVLTKPIVIIDVWPVGGPRIPE